MAVEFTIAAGDQTSALYLPFGVIDDSPCTLVAFFKVPSLPDTSRAVVGVGYDNDRGGFGLWITNFANPKVLAFVTFNFLSESASSADQYSANTWHHAAAVFASTTSRKAYLDGVPGTETTGSISAQLPFDMNLTGINTDCNSDFTPEIGRSGIEGCLAHVAIWNIALTDQDIADLSAGTKLPTDISPGNLVLYAPLTNEALATQNLGTSSTSLTLHENVDGIATCEDEPFNQLGEETADADAECGPEDEDDVRETAIEWPQCDLVPADILVQVVSQTVSPGRSFTDREQIIQPDAGKWRIELQNIAVRTRAHVLQWREIESALNGRNGVILVPFYEEAHEDAPAVSMASGAGIGEVELDVVQTDGDDIEAGMHFSHGDWGYRVKQIVSVVDGVTRIIVWPPLRYAIDLLEELDFVDPHTRCRLETDDGMNLYLELLRFSRPTVSFVEDV